MISTRDSLFTANNYLKIKSKPSCNFNCWAEVDEHLTIWGKLQKARRAFDYNLKLLKLIHLGESNVHIRTR